MSDPVRDIRVFTLTLPREVPYLGAARAGETANAKGYLVRQGNKTVYPIFDRSVLVRIETQQGVVGWGETYGLVAPGAIGAIIHDLLADFVIGREASDAETIYDDLYDLMRVRGYTGGFYVDALAALDIALWDIAGQKAGKPVAALLGGTVHASIPAYISGLPEASLARRADLATAWQAKGFDSFKFATPVADDGPVAEIERLRAALGPGARIAADMHWTNTAEQALDLIAAMAPYGLWFAEAPVRTEDVDALAMVCDGTDQRIAVGEEWRTDWDLRMRLNRCKISIVQPEMGHTGITGFCRIARLASANGIEVIPHATIGAGIFLAASLQAAATCPNVTAHEFQHSIFEPNRNLLEGEMACSAGHYTLPSGPGLGTAPSKKAIKLLQPI